jgi:hypothetical protein
VNGFIPQANTGQTVAMLNPWLTSTGSSGYASSQVTLSIPEEHRSALRKLLDLPDAAATELIAALSSAKVIPTPRAMAEQIGGNVPQIQSKDLVDILELLYALYHVREFSEVRRARFLRDLLQTIRGEFDIQKDPAQLRSRFQKLLNIGALNTLSKAIRLQRDGERLYCSTKILSDIRPVFGADPSSRPVSAVLTHTLKIGYHEGGEHKEIFFVLDEQDLEELQEIIERAKAKGRSIAQFLSDTGLPRLGL